MMMMSPQDSLPSSELTMFHESLSVSAADVMNVKEKAA